MILTFECAGEYFKYDIDRENKKVKVSSSQTNYIETELPWSKLFDPGKEKEQEILSDTLTDKEFKDLVIEQMRLYGYVLKNEQS